MKNTPAPAARDALKQPDDLRPVYDAAFDKVIGALRRGFQEAVPLAQAIALAGANLGDYVAGHPQTVKIVGNSLQPTDNKTKAELEKLPGEVARPGAQYKEAQQKLRGVLQGN